MTPSKSLAKDAYVYDAALKMPLGFENPDAEGELGQPQLAGCVGRRPSARYSDAQLRPHLHW